MEEFITITYKKGNKVKLLFIDIETTGLNAFKNGITQISAIVEIYKDNKLTKTEELNLFMQPLESDEIDLKALEVTGIDEEAIKDFQTAEDGFTQFISFLNRFVDPYNKADKFTFIGYNSTFDDKFLRQWFRKMNHNYYGSYFLWPALDVAQLAAFHLISKRTQLSNFKLKSVAQALEIEFNEEDAHDAMYDIIKTREIFNKLVEIK